MKPRLFRRSNTVSEPTSRPWLGEDCWSRGLESACFWPVGGGVSSIGDASVFVALTIAPRAHAHNRPLHALQRRASGMRMDCLGLRDPVSNRLWLAAIRSLAPARVPVRAA